MARPTGASPRLSFTSSLGSSHAFSVSRVLSNGTGGVISSVIWLTISAGLCFPWLIEKPSENKAEDNPKSVAWFLVLAADLMVGTMSVFSLWFQRSALSIMLLVWGTGGIVATFLMGSFAMLPAVATICCCAEDLCILGAADTTPLDANFCHTNLELCMETKWSLWCFYGGILLAMTSIVLLVNSVALHHKTLLDCERQRKEAAKAARAANRSRRRRQELWEQEVYGGSYAGSTSGSRAPSSRRNDNNNSVLAQYPADRSSSRSSIAIAPSFETPTRSRTRGISRPIDEIEFGGRVTPPTSFDPLDQRGTADVEMSILGSPRSVPMSQSGQDEGRGGREFTIGAYTGGAKFRDGTLDEEATRISTWGRPANTEAVMNWVGSEVDGSGQITPKTALRFKTSAIARAMHR